MPTAIEASAEIDAPRKLVWAILADLGSYPEWNPFTPKVESTLKVGEPVILHVAMKPGRKRIIQREVISSFESERELGWGMTLGASFLLRANRRQVLEDLPGGKTRYWTADVFNDGLLVPLVMALYRADIQRGFTATAAALKDRAETMARRA